AMTSPYALACAFCASHASQPATLPVAAGPVFWIVRRTPFRTHASTMRPMPFHVRPVYQRRGAGARSMRCLLECVAERSVVDASARIGVARVDARLERWTRGARARQRRIAIEQVVH